MKLSVWAVGLLGMAVAGAGEPVARVKVEDGAPQLYVHGKRTPPLMFWTTSPMGRTTVRGSRLEMSRRRGTSRAEASFAARGPLVAECTVTMQRGHIPDATAYLLALDRNDRGRSYLLGLQFLPEGNRIKLWKHDGKGWDTWFALPHSWRLGHLVRLRLEVAGKRVMGYVDGRLVAEKDDPRPLDVGTVGVGAYCCDGSFHGFRATVGNRRVIDGFPNRDGKLLAPWDAAVGGTDRLQSFAKQGIHLFSYGVSMGEWWRGPGRYDFAPVAIRLEAMRAADPESLALLRVSINPPGWWTKEHPDEVMVCKNRDGHSWKGKYASMGSSAWRTEAGDALAALAEHFTASPLSRHILGWHVAAGDCGEWSYAWGETCTDYSPAQVAAFRQWLAARYGTDDALRRAWGRADASLAGAPIPPPDRRYRGSWGDLFEPAKERDVIDYLRFHSQAVADSICHFARVAKKACRRQHLVGAFYGYSISTSWRPASWHDCGHHALARVLACRDIDFVCDPYVYRDRYPGQACVPQSLPEAIRLAGKLHLLEDDTRTFLTAEGKIGRCPDLATTIGVLRRNWAAAATQASGLWWMEQGPGWFEHPEILADLGRLRTLHGSLPPTALRSTAEIAVVISQVSQPFMAQTPNLVMPFISDQIIRELSFVGAPFDLILSSDLPHAANYKLLIFPVSYFVPEAERRRIRALCRPGRTILWLHAPGLMTDKGADPKAASALTGITLELAQIGGPAHVRITDFASALTKGLPPGYVYGTHRRVAPLLEVADPKALVLGFAGSTALNAQDGVGWKLATYRGAGLAVKEVGGARVIFSATGPVPAPLLRNIAREAGVHLYSEAGDVVYASRGLLAVHYASSGRRTLRIPRGRRVRDAITGRRRRTWLGKLRVDARAGHTDILVLE